MDQEDYRRLLFAFLDDAYVEGVLEPERRAVLGFAYLFGEQPPPAAHASGDGED